MSEPAAARSDVQPAERARRSPRIILRKVAIPALWCALLFGSAGRLDWTRGWISVAIYVGGMSILGVVVGRLNPSLMNARANWRRPDTKPFDKVILRIFLPLATLQPAVAGFDAVRFGWSSLPAVLVIPGTLLLIASIALIGWTLVKNPFAETTVRIQTERGHRVVAAGPYRFVRHPMYLGSILMYLSTPLIWGSVWALVLGGVIAALLVVRTSLEDATLQRELPGYAEFSSATPFRLIPGLW